MNQIGNEVQTLAATQTTTEIQQPERAVYITPKLENHDNYNVLIGAPGSL